MFSPLALANECIALQMDNYKLRNYMVEY